MSPIYVVNLPIAMGRRVGKTVPKRIDDVSLSPQRVECKRQAQKPTREDYSFHPQRNRRIFVMGPENVERLDRPMKNPK